MPHQTRYERGRAYEYRVKKRLEKEGWTVLRTAGSHGLFDLIAIWNQFYDMRVDERGLKSYMSPRIKLIQCKTGKSKKRSIGEVIKSDIMKWEGIYNVSVEVV